MHVRVGRVICPEMAEEVILSTMPRQAGRPIRVLSPPPAPHGNSPFSSRRGVSIVEIVVVVVVVGILLGILAPVLASVRGRARAVSCLNNTMTHARLVAVFSGDQSGSVPSFLGSPARFRDKPSLWIVWNSQGGVLLSHARWRDYAGLSPLSSAFVCPADRFGVFQRDWGQFLVPSYSVSNAFYMSPWYLRAELPKSAWFPAFGGRVGTLDEVAFPDRKSLIYEQIAWHELVGREPWETAQVNLTVKRVSVAFTDGHAAWMRAPETDGLWVQRYPRAMSGRFCTTRDGTAGMDR